MIKRRWNVHVIWFVIVLAGGITSFYLGSYAMGYALTQIAWQNHRGNDFGDLKASVWLLPGSTHTPTIMRHASSNRSSGKDFALARSGCRQRPHPRQKARSSSAS